MLLKFLKDARKVDHEKGKQVLDKMVYTLIKGYKDFNMRQGLLHQEQLSLEKLEKVNNEMEIKKISNKVKQKSQLTSTAKAIHSFLFNNLDDDKDIDH